VRVFENFALFSLIFSAVYVSVECDLGSRSSYRVSRKARRTKLESRCEKRREAYIECVARESPRLDPYPKAKRFGYDFQNLFVDV